MALAAVDRTAYSAELHSIAEYLLKRQLPNGAWSYDGIAPGGDTSMTQYALLGLWEANNGGGGPIPKEAWDRATKWLVTRQLASGGFGYHPLDPGPGVVQPEPTHTMTVASLGSLYLCRDHLPGGKPRDSHGVLQPIEPQPRADNFKSQVSPDTIRNAIGLATRWLEANFTLDKAKGETDPGGQRWFYYYLYALERFATLADLTVIAEVDWYSKAAEIILARQRPEGSWISGNDEVVDTSFAVLFLIRSTREIINRPPKGLPGGKLVVVDWKKLKISGQGIGDKAVLEEFVAEFPAEGPSSLNRLRPSRFVLLSDDAAVLWSKLDRAYATKDADTITALLKVLARTGDYRVVPFLIDAMHYEDDEDVQLAARGALCLISRRFEPKYAGATVEDWEAEIARWRTWYRSVRPQAEMDDDVVLR